MQISDVVMNIYTYSERMENFINVTDGINVLIIIKVLID